MPAGGRNDAAGGIVVSSTSSRGRWPAPRRGPTSLMGISPVVAAPKHAVVVEVQSLPERRAGGAWAQRRG